MPKFTSRWLIAVAALAAWIASAAPASNQMHFPTPDKAVEAIVAASRDSSEPRLLAILGTAGGELIHSGDSVADRQGRQDFVTAYEQGHRIELKGQDRAELIVGKEEWPLPIPLVHEADGWRFDTAAGKEEILNRRIGRNELKVIEVCREYVRAQREYALLKIGGPSGPANGKARWGRSLPRPARAAMTPAHRAAQAIQPIRSKAITSGY